MTDISPEVVNKEQTRLWSLYRSGQMDFKTFQASYPGERVPDSVGGLRSNVGPMTNRRAEWLQNLTAETTARIIAGEPTQPETDEPEEE